MNERDLSPEAQAIFPASLKRVSDLYIGELLGEVMGSLDQQERDARWRHAAEQFPPFRHKIIGLRLALNNARQAYNREGEELREVVGSRFESAGDMGVRHLLTTILCSRATKAQATVDGTIRLDIEAEAMKRELGVIPGIKGLDLETMSFNRTIETVLTGELQLSRQTQKELL